MYGIGGRVKIAFTGIFRDNENRSWITPDSDTFETKFTVENSGDSVAFVKFISGKKYSVNKSNLEHFTLKNCRNVDFCIGDVCRGFG